MDRSFPFRLDFDPPGRDGRLYIGFAKLPRGNTRAQIEAEAGGPLNWVCWYARSRLVMFGCHDKRTPPSGRFDDALSGSAGVKPSPQQVQQFIDELSATLRRVNEIAPIVAAFGWSGRVSKAVSPDPEFAEAWVDVLESLGSRTDQTFGRRPEQALKKVLWELSGDARRHGDEVFAARKAAWGGVI